jgi:hypothetical protein
MSAITELTTYRRLRIALGIVLLIIAASPGCVLVLFARRGDRREQRSGARGG